MSSLLRPAVAARGVGVWGVVSLGGWPGHGGDGGKLGGSWRQVLWLWSFNVLGVRRGAAAVSAAFYNGGGACSPGDGGTASPAVARLLGYGVDPAVLVPVFRGV